MDSPAQTLARIAAELPQLGFNDYLRRLPEAERASADAKPLRVAVLRSYTVEPIEPVLKLRLMLEGFRPAFWFGGYNQYVQDIMGPQSGFHAFQPDVVLLLIRLEELLPDFLDGFPTRSPAEWEEQLDSAVQGLGGLADRIQQAGPAQVLVQNLALPHDGYFGIHDPQEPAGQRYLLDRFNRGLAAELAARPGVFVWDYERLLRAKGHDQLADPKLWYVARNPFRQSAYPAIADDLIRYLRSMLGRVKKCVVLDLDNTLWGGVLGEEGLEGIGLGHTYPGNCYRDFQRELLKLYHRGLLLAINSKNNEADALDVIDHHPDMLLRREHFAARRINWRDKATNLRELAEELDIGLESFVYVDDSPAECALIRQACPECDVVLLPDKPYLLPEVARRLPGVENIRLTAEDRKKAEQYRVRAARREHETRYADLDEFLRSLEIAVSIEPAQPFAVPRIAQLTQKTNQMNMTTRRYGDAQIEAFAGDPAYAVYAVASRDRFGDDGIVGVLILKYAGDECLIDTFLLSCRVIGRGIEQLMVAFAADAARTRGARTLAGEFLPTAKNQPAAGLYERLGLGRASDTRFVADLSGLSVAYPLHIRFG